MWLQRFDLIPIRQSRNSVVRGLLCGLVCGVLAVALAALLLVTLTLMNHVHDRRTVFSISLVPAWYEWTRRVFWMVGVNFACIGFAEFAPGKRFGVGATDSYSFLMTLFVLNFFGFLFSWMSIVALSELGSFDLRIVVSAIYVGLTLVLTMWRFYESDARRRRQDGQFD